MWRKAPYPQVLATAASGFKPAGGRQQPTGGRDEHDRREHRCSSVSPIASEPVDYSISQGGSRRYGSWGAQPSRPAGDGPVTTPNNGESRTELTDEDRGVWLVETTSGSIYRF